jgi:TFIIF-interacting CTD phosphatase-like protein
MLTHVLLDLDSTIICSTHKDEPLDTENYNRVKHLEHHIMDDDSYTIFERPHLQEFLDYLFANYKVSVFTAASKNYALFIVDKFILTKPERHLEFIFFSYHCNISKNKYKGNHKRISLLSNDFELEHVFPLESTVLVDDIEDWAKDQQNLVINVKEFQIEKPISHSDTELVTVMAQLESKKESSKPSSETRSIADDKTV